MRSRVVKCYRVRVSSTLRSSSRRIRVRAPYENTRINIFAYYRDYYVVYLEGSEFIYKP